MVKIRTKVVFFYCRVVNCVNGVSQTSSPGKANVALRRRATTINKKNLKGMLFLWNTYCICKAISGSQKLSTKFVKFTELSEKRRYL